jgi:hypothetical protein
MHVQSSLIIFHAYMVYNSGEGWWICFARAARARARGTRAHVRNVPSSVLLKSTVQNFNVALNLVQHTACTAEK